MTFINLTYKYKVTILHTDEGISTPIFNLICEGCDITKDKLLNDETFVENIRKFAEINFGVKLNEVVDIFISQPIYAFKDMFEWCKTY